MFIFGFISTLTLFLFFGTCPNIINEPLILLVLGLGLTYLIYIFLKQFQWNKTTLYEKFVLSAGALSFLILLTPLQELDVNRPDNTQGMIIVGIMVLIMLILLRNKLKKIITNLDE